MAYRHKLAAVSVLVVLLARHVAPTDHHLGTNPMTGPSTTDISTQVTSMKKDFDLLKTVLNALLTKMRQSDATNLANKHSVDGQLLLLKTTLEDTKTRDEKQITGLSSLTNRVHVLEVILQKVEDKQDSIVKQEQMQTLATDDLKTKIEGLEVKQNVLEKMVNGLDSKLTAAMETALVDCKDVTTNLSTTFGKEIGALSSTQMDLKQQLKQQSEGINSVTATSASITATVSHVQKMLAGLSVNTDNLSKKQTDLESRVNVQRATVDNLVNATAETHGRCCEKIQNSTLYLYDEQKEFRRAMTEQERRLSNAIETCSKHDNATTSRLDDMADFQKKLGDNLQRFERTQTRLEATLDNHTKEAEETDTFLLNRQEGLATQQGSLVMEVNELERHLNLTHEMLLNETKSRVATDKQTTDTNWPKFGKCSDISAFKPKRVLATRGGTQGYIGRDPMTKGNKYYYMPGYYNTKVLTEYPSEYDFIQDTNAKTYTLPISCEGAQSQVIGGKMFCVQQNTPNVLVYDLTNLIHPFKNITLSTVHKVASRGRCSYHWGGASGIDIEIDEFGIYLIWAKPDDNCNFIITKLNQKTLDIERDWHTSITKYRTGNAFMACGKLYVTNSYHVKSFGHISYVFNTADGSIVSNPGITYNNQFGYTAHMHYDPLDKVLYVWDAGRQMQVGIAWT